MAKKKITSNNPDYEKLLTDMQIPVVLKKGAVLEGTVMKSNENEMIVNVGARAEGIVYGGELKLDGKKVIRNVGDRILVFVVNPENKEGQVELSIKQTGDELKWHELVEAKKTDTSIKVKVIEANTGGVIVEIGGGLRGFVPSSQLRNSRIYTNIQYDSKEDATKQLQSKLAQMIDEELEVKVMEIDRDKNRVILSEKHVYDEVDMEQRKSTLENLKVGDMLEGKVTAIAPFGLFVNAGGLEGLVHLSEISWDKVANPADFFKVEDTIKVQVIGLNDNGKRVAYSIKRLQSDPWKDIVKKYAVGQVVKGVVSSIADYGAFVKIEDGLNGLIHISELSHNLVKNPNDIVTRGQEVEVMIISISNEDRHLGLSIKRLQKAPKKEKKEGEEGSEASESSSEAEIVETPKKPKKAKAKKVEGEKGREMEGLEELIKEK